MGDQLRGAMATERSHGWAVASLWLSVLICAIAHLILRASARGLSENVEIAAIAGVAIGLIVYGSGTVLWILCLRRLELSFAYPASALQLVLVYLGATAFLGETIPIQRWIGVGVIVAGIAILSKSERRNHD